MIGAPSEPGSDVRHAHDGEFVGIDPADLSGPQANRLLVHCVAPRPIALVSSVSAGRIPNLAPLSYFMAGGANPPSVVISPLTDRAGRPKDTLRNIKAVGEYVINVVTYAMREEVNQASAEFPYEMPEWNVAGFTAAPSVRVGPPRVAESPLALECRLYRIVRHGAGALSANYIIGEVVYFHVARRVLSGDRIEPSAVDYIARMGGDWYTRARRSTMFELPRPAAAARPGRTPAA